MTTSRTRRPHPPIQPAGYPLVLELCAAILVLAQPAMTWFSLEHLPATVVPYFGPGRGALGLPGAALEARIWLWMVTGLWALLIGTSLLLYRAVRSTPIPIVSVGSLAFLAVLRSGVIALNLNPDLSPGRTLLRALAAGAVAVLLGATLERWRTRRRLVPALMRPALYDEPTPRGAYYWLLVAIGGGLPALFLPSRVKLMDEGLVAITPVSHLWLPAPALERAAAAPWPAAVFGSGFNLTTAPLSSVRLFRRRGWLPLVLSVKDRDRFLEAAADLTGDK